MSRDTSREVADGEREARDLLARVVNLADTYPFMAVGHLVEHVVPEIRDAARSIPTPAKDPAAHSEEGERDAWFVVRTMVNLAENGYEKAAAVAGRAALRARLRTTREPGGDDG